MPAERTDIPSESAAALPFEPLPAFRAAALDRDADFADARGKRIGILIVTYNALTTLPRVLRRITPNVWNNVEEVVIFDDASQDATYELAVGIKALRHLPKLRVLKNRENLGYGGNQKAGYRYFIEKNFDIVVLLHGDGQYAPEVLSHLYHPIVAGEADAVFGSRMMKDFGGPLRGGMPLYKFLGNRILTAYENRSLGMKLTEFHSGYRAYNLHALRAIDFAKMTGDFHFDTEIIIKLNHQGFEIREVPIPTYYGAEICYVNGLRYARDVWRAVRRYQRTIRSVEPAPEFREYYVNYALKEARYSSHDYAVRLAGANQRILDIGCGEGYLAERLIPSANRVTGIDVLPEIRAEAPLERYFSADLNAGISHLQPVLGSHCFDRVLLLDVIEHLSEPRRILEDVKKFLAPNGCVILSVPNVANLSVRLSLMAGRFEYADRGILDRTHLRFFTRSSARKFIENCGYKVMEERVTVIPLERLIPLRASHWLMRLMNQALAGVTSVLPGLLGYQVMFVVKPLR